MTSTILAISTSDKKQSKKINVEKAVIKENYGIIGDVHGDSSTQRQISLLAIESIDKIRRIGLNVNPGDFAENLTTTGIDLTALLIGKRLIIGEEVILEITQIGKKCHTRCAIYEQAGDCIMPKEGIFTRVIIGGDIKIGDKIKLI